VNYAETIDYLYKTLPMFSRMGSAAYKKDLTNIRLLCQHLGNPQNSFKSIHVGGTNGKGSVSHMLAAVFQTAGYRTGLYTSPHLYDFRERIKINGIMADEDFVVAFTEKMIPLIQEIEPSFFEITVAMAFEYFAQQEVDMAIIEVGLGGRLDSTNIITPELSVITNIGWDHMNLLGNSLEEIAGEKAGIIKEDVPVVIGEWSAFSAPVFERTALQLDAPLYFAGDLFEVVSFQWVEDLLQVDVLDKEEGEKTQYTLDLAGIYQLKNICTVLSALELLWNEGFVFSEENIAGALRNVKALTGLQGRWDVIHASPKIVLDVAHNTDGVQALLAHTRNLSHEKLRLVLGIVRDKDADAVLRILPPDACYYFTHAQIPRALDAGTLKEKAGAYGLHGDVYPDVNAALEQAIRDASKEDLIVVCGSIFLVAEVNRESIAHLA
jgi:dihydrofolate synthase/folylpolyglutamate synthase